jgi:hypothetical protein
MAKKTQPLLKDQTGTVLVIALLMMVMLTLISLSAILTSAFEVKLSGNKRGSTDAFYASENGVQSVMANIANFDLSGKYVDDRYDPFTDPNNPNPTRAKVAMTHVTDQQGSPRGLGFSAINFDFDYYLIRSTGQDQIDRDPVKSTSVLEQKVVRLVPTLQGGY